VDTEDARVRCRKFVKAGMLKHHAENALYREGFDKHQIEEAMSEFEMLRDSHRRRQRWITRLWAGAMFFICSGVFVYFAFLAPTDRHVFHLWLLMPAMFGLLKTLLP
jgi:hypothetical protein